MARIAVNGLMSTSSVDNSFVSESAAKDYLNKDGLLDIDKVLNLTKKIETQIKKAAPELKANKSGKQIVITVMAKITVVNRTLRAAKLKDQSIAFKVEEAKGLAKVTLKSPVAFTPKQKKEFVALLAGIQDVAPESVFVIGAKAKTAKYSAKFDKQKDALTYRTRRAVKVAERKKTGAAKLLLPVYPKGLLTPAQDKEIAYAAAAIRGHVKKIDKVKEKIKSDREVIRDQKAEDYAKVVEEVKSMFAGQVPDSKMVLGKTMMGAQTLYVQLPSKKVVTIGLSDLAAMRKASKLASESSFNSESSSSLYRAYDTLSEAIWSAYGDDSVIELDEDEQIANIELSNGTKTTYDFNTGTFANGLVYDFAVKHPNSENVNAAKRGASRLRSVSKSIGRPKISRRNNRARPTGSYLDQLESSGKITSAQHKAADTIQSTIEAAGLEFYGFNQLFGNLVFEFAAANGEIISPDSSGEVDGYNVDFSDEVSGKVNVAKLKSKLKQFTSMSSVSSGESMDYVNSFLGRNRSGMSPIDLSKCKTLGKACDDAGVELDGISLGADGVFGFDIITASGKTIEIDADGNAFDGSKKLNVPAFKDLMKGKAVASKLVAALNNL